MSARTIAGCWIWEHGKTGSGYGAAYIGSQQIGAHRLAYQNTAGEIPVRYQIDHECGTRLCVNPHHLDVATIKENLHRSPLTVASINRDKETCPAGHKFDRIKKRGSRVERACRKCNNFQQTVRRRAKRALRGD